MYADDIGRTSTIGAVRFSDLVGFDRQPDDARLAQRSPVDTDTYLNRMNDEPRNNGFVTALVDRRRARRLQATRRGFLRGTVAAVAATTATSAAQLFGPARKVEAQGGVVGTFPRRILQFCPPLNSNDNCQPGCGSSPICTDCCSSDGFFRNDPANGYSLFAGGCGAGDIADGWLWRFAGVCGNCSEIEYRCSDGFVQTDTGPAPFICRTVTDCVPLADGQEAGAALPDAARNTNWNPAGSLEVAIDQGGSVLINGWMADGSGTPLQMRIRANNQIVHFGTASLPRSDIAARVRGAGPNTGFGVSFPLEPGSYEFCVDALAGALTSTIGCVNLNVGSGGSARGSGSTGSITPAAPAPAPTESSDTTPPTEAPEPTPTPGTVVLPERSAASASPTYGALQIVRRSGTTTGFVSGWAGDPDVDDAAFIEVLVDGESAAITRTDLPRPDVSSAFPALHSQTGFAVSFSVPEGATEVCVEAVSPDDGRRRSLGCQQLSASVNPGADERDGRPTATGSGSEIASIVYGGIDNVTIATAGVEVSGWSFDPNDRDRLVDVVAAAGTVVATGTTGLPNEAAQRIYGVEAACGFNLALETGPGTFDVQLAAVTDDGRQIPIGQQTVVVP